GRGRARRLLVDRQDHGRGPREAARGRARAADPARRGDDAGTAAGERLPLPLLRLARHGAREHLRPDALPLAALLPQLQAAVRAVQDDLTSAPHSSGATSAIGRAKNQTWPSRSSAVKRRWPYSWSVGSSLIVAPAARARSQRASTSSSTST